MSGFDYALVGGGLQSGLLALAVRAHQPDARVCLIERADRLGGNHTWCFHDGDVSGDAAEWLRPLVVHRWSGYDVMFPDQRHTIDEPYSAITSDRLHDVVSASVLDHAASELLLAADATEVETDRVTLASGRVIEATAVIDARGPRRTEDSAPAGYQKFLGLEVDFTSPHDLDRPILMDATVDQAEGYRFVYVLPFGERRALIEDTYFHESAALDVDRLHAGIRAYAEGRGWKIEGIVREERGVLPMPWSGSFEPQDEGPLRAGYRGGWFHPGTGYSFPVAARLAQFVAGRPANALFGTAFRRLSSDHAKQTAFAEFLNRLLFRWYPPSARRSIFERFYRLPASTIRNFYALRLGLNDRARLLLGRPPRGLSAAYRFGRD